MQSRLYTSTTEFRGLRKIISTVLKHDILIGDFESSNEKYIISFRNKTTGRDLRLGGLSVRVVRVNDKKNNEVSVCMDKDFYLFLLSLRFH